MPERDERKLIVLYAQMSRHTLPECQRSCCVPLSCCDSMYCEMTIEYAREKWSHELRPTGHAYLPLMGDNGCTAAPHLRPWCTLHTCAINSIGFKAGDQEWTDKYYALRNEIETEESN